MTLPWWFSLKNIYRQSLKTLSTDGQLEATLCNCIKIKAKRRTARVFCLALSCFHTNILLLCDIDWVFLFWCDGSFCNFVTRWTLSRLFIAYGSIKEAKCMSTKPLNFVSGSPQRIKSAKLERMNFRCVFVYAVWRSYWMHVRTVFRKKYKL